MIIKKHNHKLSKLNVLWNYVHHREKDKEKAKKIYEAIKQEMKSWRWPVAQEFIISEKVKEPTKEAWERLDEAKEFFLKSLIKTKKASGRKSKMVVFKHCEVTKDGYYNIHYHVLLFIRNRKNMCMLASKEEVIKNMLKTFDKYDPERAESLKESLRRGRGKGYARIFQAQLVNKEIMKRLDTLELSPEYKELIAFLMSEAAYNKKPYERKGFFSAIPLHLQRIADRFFKTQKQRERERLRKQRKLERLFERAKERAITVNQEINYHQKKRGPSLDR